MILSLRKYLEAHKVHTRVIVGMDKPGAVRDYATTFGPDTFLDAEGRIEPPGGVPSFFVSDETGRVLHMRSGAPELPGPFSDTTLFQIAATYKALP
jgi:hypothetical protein